MELFVVCSKLTTTDASTYALYERLALERAREPIQSLGCRKLMEQFERATARSSGLPTFNAGHRAGRHGRYGSDHRLGFSRHEDMNMDTDTDRLPRNAEAERQQHELIRQAAERGRVTAEESRVSAEDGRRGLT